jgi:excisionase family DNA binding protein
MLAGGAAPPSWHTLGRSVAIDHAAELLGVSRRTIYNRIRDGRLETVRTLGGSQRVTVESLTRFRHMGKRWAAVRPAPPAPPATAIACPDNTAA